MGLQTARALPLLSCILFAVAHAGWLGACWLGACWPWPMLAGCVLAGVRVGRGPCWLGACWLGCVLAVAHVGWGACWLGCVMAGVRVGRGPCWLGSVLAGVRDGWIVPKKSEIRQVGGVVAYVPMCVKLRILVFATWHALWTEHNRGGDRWEWYW
jgi:hypothetical protein